MAKAKAKKATAVKNHAKWWRITMEDQYTDIEAASIHIDEGVLTLHNNGTIVAAWNAWRKIERIEPPVPFVEPDHDSEPLGEGADA